MTIVGGDIGLKDRCLAIEVIRTIVGEGGKKGS